MITIAATPEQIWQWLLQVGVKLQEWRDEGRRHRWACLDSPPGLPLLLREASDDQG